MTLLISADVWGLTSPVEPIAFALFQNTFAIASVTLIMIRLVTMLSQLQNADFLTRVVVQPCHPKYDVEYVLVGHKEDRDIDFTPGKLPNSSYAFQVHLTRRGPQSAKNCRPEEVFSWNWTRDQSDRATWFRRYSCPSIFGSYGLIEYTITAQTNASQEVPDDYPRLWFRDPAWMALEDDLRFNSAPYLTSPLQPSSGTYAIANFAGNLRRYIVSPGLQDVITGSQPTYVEVPFDSLTKVSVVSLNATIPACQPQSDNLAVVACGTRYPSANLASYSSITYNQLKTDPEGPYCRVIEDYRQSSALDFLGSIGGLLALLQGIHLFLFGRPLFWGMFGTKLLVPFGLCGRVATRSFRQRLQDHYNPSATNKAFKTSLMEHDVANVVRMNRFLLDYVLDMGPAAPPELALELGLNNSDTDDSVVEHKGAMRDVGRDETPENLVL